MDNMRILGVNEVAVSVDDYVDLIKNQKECDILIGALFENAKLSWNKKHLEFNGEDISLILSIIDPYEYSETIKALKEDEDGAVD